MSGQDITSTIVCRKSTSFCLRYIYVNVTVKELRSCQLRPFESRRLQFVRQSAGHSPCNLLSSMRQTCSCCSVEDGLVFYCLLPSMKESRCPNNIQAFAPDIVEPLTFELDPLTSASLAISMQWFQGLRNPLLNKFVIDCDCIPTNLRVYLLVWVPAVCIS